MTSHQADGNSCPAPVAGLLSSSSPPPIKEEGRVAQELLAFPTLLGGKGEAPEVRGRLADAGCLAARQKGC